MNKINLSRDNPRMGLFHFVRKLTVILKWTIFLGPMYKLFKSHVNYYALKLRLRIVGPIKFRKGPIKISEGPIKL